MPERLNPRRLGYIGFSLTTVSIVYVDNTDALEVIKLINKTIALYLGKLTESGRLVIGIDHRENH